MSTRFNTTAGWVLFAGIVALGFTSVSGKFFSADKVHRPDQMGFPIEGAEEEGGADSGPSLATLLASADLAKGESVFGKCVSCHTINQGGADGIGPNLYAVMGGKVGGHIAGYAYSAALSGVGGTWGFENMDAWLTSPRAFANGTKMSFAGLGKSEDRANLIAYLNAQGSNLPLPAAEEPAAEEEVPADESENADAAAEEAAGEEASDA